MEWVSRPITGKFEHISSDVSNYYFEGLEQLIGATSVHPFWSVDRQDWIAVGDLEIGERVKTKAGISALLSKEKLEGQHSVFNLEVYREHNFLVSESGVLVHNTYWQQRLKKFMEYADNIDASKLTSQDETIQHLENVFRFLDKTKTDDRILRLVGENNVIFRDGIKTIYQAGSATGGNYTKVFPNGGFQIFRDHKVIINKLKE
ncbi:MAG: polymorphic toxin-type HINT domain-containing protein [Chitinophagales bacterium]